MTTLYWHWERFPGSWHGLVLAQQSCALQYLSLTVLIHRSKLDLGVE